MRGELSMRTTLRIDSIDEYRQCVERGFEPLIDDRFELPIELRIEIQRQLFGHVTRGRGNIPQANERFFRWVWERKPHRCEETLRPLHNYSAVYVSHILSRGAHPEMAHDPRNVNILCAEMHNMWENGRRQSMRIWEKNSRIIKILKNEYQEKDNL